jgi:alpha-tubulin suppressor-like RCC1 family protein
MPAMRFPVMVAAVAVCLSAMEMRVEAVTMVAAGWRHSVALDDDGRLRAWGEGRMGQTGNGEFAIADRPVTVVGPDGEGALTGVVSVAAGLFHTLAIREDGSVWAWGANSFGQLGNGRWGPDAHSAVPVQVLGLDGEGHLEGAIAVSGGWDHSVALLEDGTVVAWGSRCQGQLGDGLRDSNSWSEHPVRVRGPNGEGRLGGGTALACGAHHTVVLREDGTLLAWGGNFEGQLGRGHTGDRGRMHRVSFELAWTPPTAGHWSIALGYTYTDPSHRDVADRVELVDEFDGPPLEVVTEATAVDRRTGRFSRDENHVLMRATLTYPARAPVGESVVLELQEILVGLNTADDDFAEEIHLLLTNRETGEQVRLDAGDGTALALARPAPVIGPDGDGVLEDILAVAAGVYHTVALREDGSVWAWGHNSTGQLGDGTRGTTATPVQMAAGEQGEGHLERIAAVAAGFESSYALGEDGRVWACGWNVYGQLGAALPASAATGHPEIRQVVTGSETAGPLEEITAIAAGTYHALARNASGDLLAWGHNGFGQLGDGTVRDRASAVPVVALESGFEPEPPRLPTGVAPPAPVVDLQHAEVDAAAGNVLNVLEHGAKGDGVHLDWEALQGAIDAAHEAGGGVVLLPPGTYRTGSLELLGGVRLHLEEGATLLGSTNRDHYQRGRARPGVIWAEGADNIAITGQGVIDGQGAVLSEPRLASSHPQHSRLQQHRGRGHQHGQRRVVDATLGQLPRSHHQGDHGQQRAPAPKQRRHRPLRLSGRADRGLHRGFGR